MDGWDQEKLEKVITEKHGPARPENETKIVCKHFLDAIEKSQYGWFWVCPNGGKACKYRHALPPGYVFKTKAERDLERNSKTSEITVEEIIEEQRRKLGATGGTPVTEETLKKWKEDKAKRKAAAMEAKRKEEAKKSGGRGLSMFLLLYMVSTLTNQTLDVLSGRALFSYDPSLFRDDNEADGDEFQYNVDDGDDVEEKPPAMAPVDQAAKTMDKSLYLNGDDVNVEDLA